MLFASQQEWDEWLAAHHATQPEGVWLKLAKKGAPVASVTYAEAVDTALCYGWIDGQKKAFDAQFSLQKFTPRRPRSIWSKINTAKAEQLIASGRMQPAGLQQIEAAKRDGRWDAAYHSHSTFTQHEDFLAALEEHPEAKAFFETLNKTNQHAIYFHIQNAKRPETRKARIEKYVAMLERHEKLYP